MLFRLHNVLFVGFLVLVAVLSVSIACAEELLGAPPTGGTLHSNNWLWIASLVSIVCNRIAPKTKNKVDDKIAGVLSYGLHFFGGRWVAIGKSLKK